MTTSLGHITTSALTVKYGAFTALSDVSIELKPGLITGLIGPNGAGKTTLFNALSGFTPATSGTVTLDGLDITELDARGRARIGVIRGFQTVRLLERESVLDNVLLGLERNGHPLAITQLLALPTHWRSRKRDHEAASRVLALLGLEDDADRPVEELPFASRRLVEVGRVLVSQPPVVLLDEPAAGLDQQGRQELTAALKGIHEQTRSTMAVVEHDIDFVSDICDEVIALESGAHLLTGTAADVFANARVQAAYFGRTADASA